MIKLVAIDLDGTLLNEQKLISDENKQALAQAKQQGVKIVLCTGRPLAAMAHYLQELGLVDEGVITASLSTAVWYKKTILVKSWKRK